MQNCYSKSKVPALLTEQDERLTAKHVKALSFLQDLGKENKTLKSRVQELEVCICICTLLIIQLTMFISYAFLLHLRYSLTYMA